MNYLSLAFAGFVLLLMILYYVAQKKALGWVVLLAGSIIFYCSFDLKYLMFLGFAALSTYGCALCLQKVKHKKLLTALCITANIGVWFWAKALSWTVALSSNIFEFLGFQANWWFSPILVPVGISYFTLQAIAYLVDVSSGKIHPEKNPAKYLLFIAYFPAIVQGPISRYNELMPQLLNNKPFHFESMRKSVILILFGLVKKMVVADRLAIFVNACFNGYQTLSGVVLYLGAVGYAIQLYMDFSGCVDICRGVSSLFHVNLVNNFNRPYLSTSIKDFWSKWHMSLSRWLRDYVYIPLGGNRKGTGRKYLNLLITFLVSGLWHGAGFSFFLWGALHAAYQIIGQATKDVRERLKARVGIISGSFSERIYQTVITFHLVTFAWIFFRAPTLADAFQYLQHMFSEFNFYALTAPIFELGVNQNQFLLLILHLFVFLIADIFSKQQEALLEGINNQHIILRWVVLYILVMDVFLLGVYGPGYDMSGFLYGGF